MQCKSNALEELAKRLKERYAGMAASLKMDENADDILKAHRIVLELAKVAYAEGLSYNAVNAVARSRAIAEEG